MLAFALLAALWGAFVYALVILWRLYNRSLGAVAGRPVEYCRSLYLVPAQMLGLIGGLCVLTAVVGLASARSSGDVPIGLVLLALGVGGVLLARLLVRRGSL